MGRISIKKPLILTLMALRRALRRYSAVDRSYVRQIIALGIGCPIEVSPVLDFNKEGETRYDLEEYMELETQLTGAKSVAETHEPKMVEDELVFEKTTIKVDATQAGTSNEGGADPFNSSIDDLLKERADERRKKLKSFNYKFKNNRSNIDEIEKQPAYKRQGIDLDEEPKEQKVSRMSLGKDSNDEIQLRSNNSFLHDNVD